MQLLPLEPSLLAEAYERHFVDSVDWLFDGTGAELGDGLDPREVQPACLIATHAGDEAEMVVPPPAQLADVDPAADTAVVHRIWIGAPATAAPPPPPAQRADVDPAADTAVVHRIWIGAPTLPSPRGGGKNNLFELAFDAPVVGAIVLQAQVFLSAVAEDTPNLLRLDSLEGGDLFGGDAALEDSRRLRLPGELRVGDLVAIGAELAGTVDPQQEVGMASPAAIEEGALVDDVG